MPNVETDRHNAKLVLATWTLTGEAQGQASLSWGCISTARSILAEIAKCQTRAQWKTRREPAEVPPQRNTSFPSFDLHPIVDCSKLSKLPAFPYTCMITNRSFGSLKFDDEVSPPDDVAGLRAGAKASLAMCLPSSETPVLEHRVAQFWVTGRSQHTGYPRAMSALSLGRNSWAHTVSLTTQTATKRAAASLSAPAGTIRLCTEPSGHETALSTIEVYTNS